MASNVTDMQALNNDINDLFQLTNGIILILMQIGFACLEAGAVRSKNTTNIMMKNLMDICFSCVSYWLVGYALAYGRGDAVLGYTYFAGTKLPAEKLAHWFFQFGFAATAATIVSGAVAERCNYIAYIVYSIGISGFVYPPVTHWAWTDEGWLNKLGYVDFAGSGPIHLLGGVCSFCAALFLGPRLGRFGAGKEQIVGHSVPLTGIGGMLLIVGFLSFNGGSLGTITNPGDGATVARVMINTLLGASGGSVIILASTKTGIFGPSTWSFSLTLNAAITGMVSVCASLNKMEFWASFLTGVIAGVVFINIHYLMLWCKVDDPLDAVAVHFGGGFWGVISASLFSHGGIVYGANKQSAMFLAYEMVGACAIILWGWAASCVMFGTLKLLGKLRVSEEDEQKGLDIAMHNEPGYHPMGWKTFPPVSETSPALVSQNGGQNQTGRFQLYYENRDKEMATPTVPSDGGEELAELKKNIDDVFILTNAIIVCLMQCGFACLEAGAVRSKNTTNIIMKNFMDIFISALCYWLAGYALAYGDGNPFVGYTYWAGIGVQGQKMAHWFFQFVFAATAATLVSGAVAERCNFVAYITYSAVISGFVYPVASRWVWAQDGWLNQMGYRDFSGCGPVHLLGGTCSLFGAAFLGPRLGRFSSKMEDSQKMPGHSVPLTGLGGMILITGFLAFNGGTLGTMTNPRDSELIARVISNTVMGGSGGSITVMLVGRLGLGGAPSWSFMCTLNGAFIGMVSVCAGVNEMNMWESFVSGIIAGPIYMIIHYAVLWCKIDDPLDTVAIHLGGGVWGLISASIFSNSGLVFGITRKSLMLLAYRMAGATIIFSWASVTSCIMFGILKCTGKLRVSAKDEQEGLDLSLHNEPGYPVKGWQMMVVSVQGNSV